MVQEGRTARDVALELASWGLQVLPAASGQKSPRISWKKWQNQDSHSMLNVWFSDEDDETTTNYWVLTGQRSKVVVIDCDSALGHAWWEERCPDLAETTQVESRPGHHHHWYRIPDDCTHPIKGWSVHDGSLSFDVRADGGGVLAPPSLHPETGLPYRWLVPLRDALWAPPGLLDGQYALGAPRSSGGSRRGTGADVRGMLPRLLNNPPPEGGRNDWLARVAGHYAKQFKGQREAYEWHTSQANNVCKPPLTDTECQKVMDSIWDKENESLTYGMAQLSKENGFLCSDGLNLLTQVKQGDQRVLHTISDFTIRAEGIMVDELGHRTYWITVIQQDRKTGLTNETDAIIQGKVFGDDALLRRTLASYEATIQMPVNAYPPMAVGVRLQRYIASQNPPAVVVTDKLGWHQRIFDGQGGFVTHEHVITADKVYTNEEAGIRPDPALMTGNTAPHKYGFEGNWEQASAILEEVLTFQDETVASVFGAWWAACILKPKLHVLSSLFPFMAIEAASGSGKTNGFFAMMMELNGLYTGEAQPTKAAMRDMAAAHQSGIVWVDDLDDPKYLTELLRAATSGGTISKMAIDRSTIKSVRLTAPIVVSGESLGMNDQKALVDRAIPLRVDSPVGRRSLRNPERPQWDDIQMLREAWPGSDVDGYGLSVFAGWYVQKALGVEKEFMNAFKAGTNNTAGRIADKDGILRAGARLLDYFTGCDDPWDGEGPHYRRVDAWLRRRGRIDADSNENKLTLTIIPWALRQFEYPDKAYRRTNEKLYGNIDTPVFIRVDATTGQRHVWFTAGLLAEAWKLCQHGFIEKRTDTADALRDQARALGCECMQQRVVGASRGTRLRYWRLPSELTDIIVERSQD